MYSQVTRKGHSSCEDAANERRAMASLHGAHGGGEQPYVLRLVAAGRPVQALVNT